MRQEVIVLVETGWRGMRELSLFLREKGFSVSTLIKGRISQETVDIITKYPEIKLVWLNKRLFRLSAFFEILKRRFFRDLKYVVVSKERTRNWVGRLGGLLGFKTFLLIEENGFYRLITPDGAEVRKEGLI